MVVEFAKHELFASEKIQTFDLVLNRKATLIFCIQEPSNQQVVYLGGVPRLNPRGLGSRLAPSWVNRPVDV